MGKNDDGITADLLLYCLFVRTYDIFTPDEVYEELEKLNNDIFYLFMWSLCMGEWGYGYDETYNLDDDEKERVSEIIKARKHPREKKLLEQLYR